jgi:hypothetical protein
MQCGICLYIYQSRLCHVLGIWALVSYRGDSGFNSGWLNPLRTGFILNNNLKRSLQYTEWGNLKRFFCNIQNVVITSATWNLSLMHVSTSLNDNNTVCCWGSSLRDSIVKHCTLRLITNSDTRRKNNRRLYFRIFLLWSWMALCNTVCHWIRLCLLYNVRYGKCRVPFTKSKVTFMSL